MPVAKGNNVFFVLDGGPNAGETRPAIVVDVIPATETEGAKHSITVFLKDGDDTGPFLQRQDVPLQNPIEPFQGTIRLEE